MSERGACHPGTLGKAACRLTPNTSTLMASCLMTQQFKLHLCMNCTLQPPTLPISSAAGPLTHRNAQPHAVRSDGPGQGAGRLLSNALSYGHSCTPRPQQCASPSGGVDMTGLRALKRSTGSKPYQQDPMVPSLLPLVNHRFDRLSRPFVVCEPGRGGWAQSRARTRIRVPHARSDYPKRDSWI